MRVVSTLPVLAALALGGCGLFSKAPPDEFMVVRERPLVMPPADTALPLPGQASPASAARDSATGARDALLVPAPASTASAGEQALLGRLGAADPGIRAEITADAAASEETNASSSLFDSPFQQGASSGGEAISPAAEAERLRREGTTTTGPATATGQGS